jgi:3-oxoacyl-[acyl-carrier-protein] synthase-3
LAAVLLRPVVYVLQLGDGVVTGVYGRVGKGLEQWQFVERITTDLHATEDFMLSWPLDQPFSGGGFPERGRRAPLTLEHPCQGRGGAYNGQYDYKPFHSSKIETPAQHQCERKAIPYQDFSKPSPYAMPLLFHSGIGISAMAAAVPRTCQSNLHSAGPWSQAKLESAIGKLGIRERRVVAEGVCASDLCFAAAERLFKDTTISRESVDLLIFVSQTPDYRMPATAIILQNRLGLSKDTAAFDINLGCSGFVYGLSIAYAYCSSQSVNRVLLLNGETRTRVVSPRDKSTGLIFGDAGSATLIEKNTCSEEQVFSLNSDGGRYEYIIIPAGGYRKMASPESLKEVAFADGSVRSQENAVMNGPSLAKYFLHEIPLDIKRVLAAAKIAIDDCDYILLHQASLFINERLQWHFKIPVERCPYSMREFGNTSSVSIPLTMVSQLAGPLGVGKNRVLMSGFGVGLSWATAHLVMDRIKVCDLVEI